MALCVEGAANKRRGLRSPRLSGSSAAAVCASYTLLSQGSGLATEYAAVANESGPCAIKNRRTERCHAHLRGSSETAASFITRGAAIESSDRHVALRTRRIYSGCSLFETSNGQRSAESAVSPAIGS